ALPLLHARLRAEAVFEEQKRAAQLQHPVHLGQGLIHLLDAAQGKRADDAIEAVVLERQPFTAEPLRVNLDSRLLDPFLRLLVHASVRLNSRQAGDVGGVVREVQAGPEANLQYVAVGGGKQLAPVPADQRAPQDEIAEAREDDLREEAHNVLPVTSPGW